MSVLHFILEDDTRQLDKTCVATQRASVEVLVFILAFNSDWPIGYDG